MNNVHTSPHSHQANQEGQKSPNREADMWHKPRQGWHSVESSSEGNGRVMLNAYLPGPNCPQPRPT